MAVSPPTMRQAARTAFAVLGVVVVAWVLYTSRRTVAAIFASALIAAALAHGVEALEHRGVRRGLARAIVLTLFLAALGGGGAVLLPRAASQASELVQRAPAFIEKVENHPLVRRVERVLHQGGSEKPAAPPPSIGQVAPPAIAAVGGAIGVLVHLVMVLFLTVFMVLFGGEVIRAGLSLTSPVHRPMYERVLDKVYRLVGGYMGGLVLICSINATLTTTFLALTGTPYFLALGILSGFSSLVPYAGPFVVHASITLFALASGGPWHALGTAAYFVVYDSLEGNVLGPLVFKRTVHVNPLVSLASVLVLGEFAGVVGALVAVPAAAAGQIILREYVALRRGSAPPQGV